MKFDPTSIASYTFDDVQPKTWDDTDPESSGGYIADEGDGVNMGLAFVRFTAGVRFEFAWPYDEISVVTAGSVTVRTNGSLLTAYEGELLNQPRGVPAQFEIAEDMEMICVHYPTFAKAFGITVHEHNRLAESGGTAPEPTVEPRGPEHAGQLFDPTIMQVFRAADMSTWQTVEGSQGGRMAQFSDRAEDYSLGLNFTTFPANDTYELQPTHEMAAAVTQGSFTVNSQGRSFTVSSGELVYMPPNVAAELVFAEDTTWVGIHPLQ